MRRAVAVAMLLVAAPCGAQSGDGAAEVTEPIVVTGIRIQDYRDRLAACLARGCPPDEDVAATLALAEAQLLEGEYRDARTTVRESIGRNRDEARNFPEPVSDLYRADARLSRHLGFDREALRSTHQILNALQEGLPREDHRHFTARLEIAEVQMAMARLRPALRELDRLEREARQAGRSDVVTLVELRKLWYRWIAEPDGPARAQLIEMSRSDDPDRRMAAVGARFLLARIHIEEGDRERADALLAEIGRGTTVRRRLLHSPDYQLQAHEVAFGRDEIIDLGTAMRFGNALNRLPDNFEDRWIDIGFWVMPDGRVSGLEIVRRGAEAGWADPLLESVRGRIYSTADEPTFRLERYTYTAGWDSTATGRRIRTRSPRARVEYLDLTVPGATVGDPPTP